MARSTTKGPFIHPSLFKKVAALRLSGKLAMIIQTYSRKSLIVPDFVGITFGVYNGKKFIPVLVTEDMVGHKFGEFSPTRTYLGHGADKKKK
ncbi:MAG: 30S ribosomal protein S19 [Alphaproteobacteria bacterium CG11_big_fil_rev_8_21_14_0_20_44_7]|nr:MAG: 30S ribosomal protein S19 [Alphaproteobacteria bacterium CG11_big_fil_rev_8_21_14_0_20_44_7]